MEINLNTLNLYLEKYKCPTQIYINTNMSESMPALRLLRGSDENGSRVEFLTFTEINDILELNDVTAKMIAERDAPNNEMKSRYENDRDREKKIKDIQYGILAKYIIQLFSAGTGILAYPELQILPGHKKTHFASIFNQL